LRWGVCCGSVLPLRGEGEGGLHSFDGTSKWDAVLVCRRGNAPGHSRLPAVVSLGAITEAAAIAEQYAKRLMADETIGFRDPDKLNLYRALVVTRARLGAPQKGAVRLLAALESIPDTEEGR